MRLRSCSSPVWHSSRASTIKYVRFRLGSRSTLVRIPDRETNTLLPSKSFWSCLVVLSADVQGERGLLNKRLYIRPLSNAHGVIQIYIGRLTKENRLWEWRLESGGDFMNSLITPLISIVFPLPGSPLIHSSWFVSPSLQSQTPNLGSLILHPVSLF